MVLEQLYGSDFLVKHPIVGFLLGFGYTIVGVALSMLLFPDDPALIAVGITAILTIPTLSLVANKEETSLENGLLPALREHLPLTKLYVWLFFGSFAAFAVFALVLPSLATNILFKQQLSILFGKAFGPLDWSNSLFLDIFINNIKVFLLCFILSLMAGNGAVLMILWQSSVWGTIFGNIAKVSALKIAANPLIIIVLILIAVLPHVFLEILSYVLSVVSGTSISAKIASQSLLSEETSNALMLNLVVLGIGFIVLLIAAGVEVLVLKNVTLYHTISQFAFKQ